MAVSDVYLNVVMNFDKGINISNKTILTLNFITNFPLLKLGYLLFLSVVWGTYLLK